MFKTIKNFFAKKKKVKQVKKARTKEQQDHARRKVQALKGGK